MRIFEWHSAVFFLAFQLLVLGCNKALVKQEESASAETYLEMALDYANKSDYDKAIEYYKKVIELEPGFVLAYGFIGDIYADRGDYDEAIEYYQKATELVPDSRMYLDVGNAYYHKRDYGKAMECYLKAIELDSSYAQAHNNIGLIYFHRKDYGKAIEHYEKAIESYEEMSPENRHWSIGYLAEAYCSIGGIYDYAEGYEKANDEKAIEYYEKAVELKPDYAKAYLGIGNSYRSKQDYDKAIEYYKKVLEYDAANAYAYYGIGKAYFHKQDYDKAIEHYKEVLEADPYFGLVFYDINKAYEAKGYKNIFIDSRDGKEYKTVKINDQIWMAENLSYKAGGSKCYGNYFANCDGYGRLYDWDAAMNACPSGWRLPSYADWNELYRFVDGSGWHSTSSAAGKALKSKSGNGLDAHGFSALLGGYGYLDGSFKGIGSHGVWWTASKSAGDDIYGQDMYLDEDYTRHSISSRFNLYSIRCLRYSYREWLWE